MSWLWAVALLVALSMGAGALLELLGVAIALLFMAAIAAWAGFWVAAFAVDLFNLNGAQSLVIWPLASLLLLALASLSLFRANR